MKIIVSLIGLCFTIITATIVYLILNGVSIRTAPIIKPSSIIPSFKNVPHGLFLRLFPDFQQADYVLWGAPLNSPEFETMLKHLKEYYQNEFKQIARIIPAGENASLAEVAACSKPCWIFFTTQPAHELSPNSWIQKNLLPLKKSYFSITWMPFHRNFELPEYCNDEKRLDQDCLKALSIDQVKKDFKSKNERYFFARKYMDRDYFLFIEENSK